MTDQTTTTDVFGDDEDPKTPGYVSWDDTDWDAVEYMQARIDEVEALRGTPEHRAAAEALEIEIMAARQDDEVPS